MHRHLAYQGLLALLMLALAACSSPVLSSPEIAETPATGRANVATPTVPPTASPAPAPSRAPEQLAVASPTVVEATAIPSPTVPPPTATALPSPTPVPEPSLRQLATGGCCVNPSWRPDGEAIRFLDRPSAAAPAGIYEILLSSPEPVDMGVLVTTTLPSGIGTTSDRYTVTTGSGQVTIEERATGRIYTLPEGASQVVISPDETRVAWQVRSDGGSGGPFIQAHSAIWVATLDGDDPQLLLEGRGASISGWLGAESLLLQARDEADEDERRLLRVDLPAGRITELDRGARFSGLSISRGGTRAVYFISLDYDDPDQNGLWVLDTTTGVKEPLPQAGAYRWRDGTRLLFIPLELQASTMRLQEYDAVTSTWKELTDPARLPFRVANNDWIVSPDGSQIVFVSADDNNLWLLAPLP
jgi:hypothetical protein